MSNFCSNCGAKLQDQTRFCTSCGHEVQSAAPPIVSDRRGGEAELGNNTKVKRFTGNEDTFSSLAPAMVRWLDDEDFDCQTLSTDDDKTLIQISKRGGWRKFIGMSTALNVLLSQEGKAITAEIGAGKWIDKAAVGTVSIFVLWPLAVTAAIGAWNQAKMPERVFDFIERHLHDKP